MKKTDRMTAASVIAAIDADFGDKRVKNTGHVTEVFLHGLVCLTVDRQEQTVTVNGSTPCTRKSSRLINTVLESLTGARVESHDGKWFIRRDGKTSPEEFTGWTATAHVRQGVLMPA